MFPPTNPHLVRRRRVLSAVTMLRRAIYFAVLLCLMVFIYEAMHPMESDYVSSTIDDFDNQHRHLMANPKPSWIFKVNADQLGDDLSLMGVSREGNHSWNLGKAVGEWQKEEGFRWKHIVRGGVDIGIRTGWLVDCQNGNENEQCDDCHVFVEVTMDPKVQGRLISPSQRHKVGTIRTVDDHLTVYSFVDKVPIGTLREINASTDWKAYNMCESPSSAIDSSNGTPSTVTQPAHPTRDPTSAPTEKSTPDSTSHSAKDRERDRPTETTTSSPTKHSPMSPSYAPSSAPMTTPERDTTQSNPVTRTQSTQTSSGSNTNVVHEVVKSKAAIHIKAEPETSEPGTSKKTTGDGVTDSDREEHDDVANRFTDSKPNKASEPPRSHIGPSDDTTPTSSTKAKTSVPTEHTTLHRSQTKEDQGASNQSVPHMIPGKDSKADDIDKPLNDDIAHQELLPTDCNALIVNLSHIVPSKDGTRFSLEHFTEGKETLSQTFHLGTKSNIVKVEAETNVLYTRLMSGDSPIGWVVDHGDDTPIDVIVDIEFYPNQQEEHKYQFKSTLGDDLGYTTGEQQDGKFIAYYQHTDVELGLLTKYDWDKYGDAPRHYEKHLQPVLSEENLKPLEKQKKPQEKQIHYVLIVENVKFEIVPDINGARILLRKKEDGSNVPVLSSGNPLNVGWLSSKWAYHHNRRFPDEICKHFRGQNGYSGFVLRNGDDAHVIDSMAINVKLKTSPSQDGAINGEPIWDIRFALKNGFLGYTKSEQSTKDLGMGALFIAYTEKGERLGFVAELTELNKCRAVEEHRIVVPNSRSLDHPAIGVDPSSS